MATTSTLPFFASYRDHLTNLAVVMRGAFLIVAVGNNILRSSNVTEKSTAHLQCTTIVVTSNILFSTIKDR